jgi:hypothetical protein
MFLIDWNFEVRVTVSFAHPAGKDLTSMSQSGM